MSESTDTRSRLPGLRFARSDGSHRKTAVVFVPNVLLRESIRRLIHAFDFARVVGAASTTEEALELVASTRPDIVITDFHYEVLDGIAVCTAARGQFPRPRVIFCTDIRHASTYHNRIIRSGASALILHHAPINHWLYVVGNVEEGNVRVDLRDSEQDMVFVDPYLSGLLQQDQQLVQEVLFSDMEMAVLTRLRMSREQIARELQLPLSLIQVLEENLIEALGADNNVDAVERAESLGYKLLLSPDTLDVRAQQVALTESIQFTFAIIEAAEGMFGGGES